MIFDADRVSRAVIVLLIATLMLGAGLVIPKLLIADVHADTDLQSPETLSYVEARIGNTGGLGQRAMRMQISIIDSRPDPRNCDWGYGEPVSEIVTARVYTLWGLPVDTWELSCDDVQKVSGPLSW
jgi:hypothetical protein